MTEHRTGTRGEWRRARVELLELVDGPQAVVIRQGDQLTVDPVRIRVGR
jgi:hypothetical protein